jgi:hypothetical protein
MDIASVLRKTDLSGARKFFVSNKTRKWYIDCAEELTEQINRLSGRSKILLGNSMGGYAAMRFAPCLQNVVSVLSFVPQIGPQPYDQHRKTTSPDDDVWLRFVPGIQYCVLYGSGEDAYELAYLSNQITDPETQHIVVVPGCGHNVVPHLHATGRLGAVLGTAARPTSMAPEIRRLCEVRARDPSCGSVPVLQS